MSRYPESEPAGPRHPHPHPHPRRNPWRQRPATESGPGARPIPAFQLRTCRGPRSTPAGPPRSTGIRGGAARPPGLRPSGCIRALSGPAPPLPSFCPPRRIPAAESRRRPPSAPRGRRGTWRPGPDGGAQRAGAHGTVLGPLDAGCRSGLMPTCSSLRLLWYSDASSTQAFLHQCMVSTDSVPGTGPRTWKRRPMMHPSCPLEELDI